MVATDLPSTISSFPLSMASLAGASTTLEEVLSCVTFSPGTRINAAASGTSCEGVLSTSMMEGSDAAIVRDPMGAADGWTAGAGGTMVGEAWTNIYRMF